MFIVSQWTSGIEPYEFSTLPDVFDQPQLSAKIISSVLKMNADVLKHLPSPVEGKNVLEWAEEFIHDGIMKQHNFEQVLDYILDHPTRYIE